MGEQHSGQTIDTGGLIGAAVGVDAGAGGQAGERVKYGAGVGGHRRSEDSGEGAVVGTGGELEVGVSDSGDAVVGLAGEKRAREARSAGGVVGGAVAHGGAVAAEGVVRRGNDVRIGKRREGGPNWPS